MADGDPVPRDDNYFRYLSPEPAPHELGIPDGYSAPLELKTATEMMADRAIARAERQAKADAVLAWMREPDHVETANLEWFTSWLNRRPLAELLAIVGSERACR